MPQPNPAALEFLQTRRSCPAKILTTPVPDRGQLMEILTAAARSPDHGKLEPWRFIVLQGSVLLELAALARQRGPALSIDPEKIEKNAALYEYANLVVAVVSAPIPSQKVPEIEQVQSAGAVCLSMLNAALAAGWGANWLSGWTSHDREFLRNGFKLDDHETLAGLIHIGTARHAPPERPRPDVDALTTWVTS